MKNTNVNENINIPESGFMCNFRKILLNDTSFIVLVALASQEYLQEQAYM